MQKKRGISLIVLVITIIVMIILAAAIVISLNNSGIINKANEAVNKTDNATLKNIASLAWSEAYMDGVRSVEDIKDENGEIVSYGFRSKINAALEANKIDPADCGMIVTEKGVEIAKGWIKDGFYVVKGNQRLEIGDTVKYNAGVSSYTSTWKVLGADEDGNLLILSSNSVSSKHKVGYESTDTTFEDKMEENQNDWISFVDELNAICEPFGHGKGALGARSITIEDVNSVSGYNPEKQQYGKDTVYQYGNVVTYKYNKSVNPAYESDVINGTHSYSHNNGFYYYDGIEFQHVTAEELKAEENNGKVICTLTSNAYTYDVSTLDTIDSEENKKAYNLLFNSWYWVASTYIRTGSPIHYGRWSVAQNLVSNGAFLWSGNFPEGAASSNYVRAVVTLSSDIDFEGSSDAGWSY